MGKAAAGLSLLLGAVACSSNGATTSEPLVPGADQDAAVQGDSGGKIQIESDAANPNSGAIQAPADALSQCPMPADQEACVGGLFEGKSTPLDIYIMFDQSGSMCSCLDPAGGTVCPDPACSMTRLDAVRRAVKAFLDDPRSAGMGVGIGYFGQQPIGQTSCNVADYATPAVPIGTLPGNALTIMGSLTAVAPTGETPTGQAIEAACQYTRAWKKAAPGHQVVNLLLTDGEPQAPVTCKLTNGTCCPLIDHATAAATACATETAEQPGIKTYVLGVGPLLDNLNKIAAAGGTGTAYLVEGGDVSGKVLDALNRIRGDASIPCELALPPAPAGTTLALDKVNVNYTDSECHNATFFYVENALSCSEVGGWYYDNPTAPQKIQLCKTSCDQVSGPGGRLLYTLGCATKKQILK